MGNVSNNARNIHSSLRICIKYLPHVSEKISTYTKTNIYFLKDHMKPNATFRLSKPTKTLLSRMTDSAKASHFKRMMIEAQLAATEKNKSAK